MFERNKVDTVTRLHTVNVEIECHDGCTLSGRIAIPASRPLLDALNGQGCFIEFEPFEGERRLLAKSALRSIRLLRPPKAPRLDADAPDRSGFDPHAILEVTKGIDADGLRRAYLERSKAYHPDRFASVELPAEVTAYLETMARRVNMAYEALQPEATAIKPVRSEPVWQSR